MPKHQSPAAGWRLEPASELAAGMCRMQLTYDTLDDVMGQLSCDGEGGILDADLQVVLSQRSTACRVMKAQP